MAAASPMAVGHALAAVVASPGGPTTVATTGAISTVTTSHVTTGANGVSVGLNTFSQFNVGSGLTVNLMVPTNASALVNVVRDSKVEIDGIVNSYKAGKIGGDVFFVAPQGLVVGATGTINVGSLNVATTTTAFADTLTASGADLLANLSASDIPLASDGSIVVSGHVNALDGVTLQAPKINVASGAAINAGQAGLSAISALFTGTVNASGIPDATALTTNGGAIELVAEQSQTGGEGATATTTSIDVSGALKGDYITLASAATAQADWTSSLADISTTTEQGLLSGIAAAYVHATGTASIDLHSGADLEAGGAILVGASTITLADMPVLEASAGKFAISAVVAQVDASATVSVESGATVLSTGNGAVSFTAGNTATLDATSYNMAARKGSLTADTAATATGTVTSSVDVAHGATIGGGLINVQARNDDSISVSATSFATKDAKAGIAVSVADVSDSADAEFDADLGTAASKAGSLSVSAFSNTSKNEIAATTSLGSGIAADAFSTGSGEFDGVSGLLASKVADGLTSAFSNIGDKIAAAQSTTDVGDSGSDSKATPQLGSAIIVGLEHHSATANIGDPTTATKIYVTGAATSAAQTADGSIGNEAASEVATDSSSPNAPAISAVVSYFDDSHTTTATIAPGTTLDAGSIAVNAQTQLPAAISTGEYDSASDIYNNLTSTTSRAAAIGDSDGLDLTGVVNLTLITDTTKAWVGRGAILTAEGTTTPAPLALATDWTITPASSLDVEAYNTLGTIEASGEFAFKDLLAKSTDASGKEIGGSYTESEHTSSTVAGIDADAVVSTPGALTVQAANTDVSATLAPDSGRGASIGATGMVARTVVNDTTHAEISKAAQISTPSISLVAADTPHVVTVAAVVQSTGDEAFGAGIALNHIAADTAAFVGDASTDSPTSAIGTLSGFLNTDSLNVSAHTGGFITAVGVAGADVSGDDDQSTGSGTGTASSAKLPGDEEGGAGEPTFQAQSGGLLASAKAALGKVSDAVDGVTTKIANKIAGTSGAATGGDEGGEGETKTPPAISLNLAGSVAYNQSNLTTRAELTGARVSHYGTGPVATTLTAISDPVLVSGAGAGARLSTSGSTGTSASVAAALTLDDSANRAEATISGGSLSHAGATAVHALNGGVHASAALGLAVTTKGSTALSGEGAGSASILINADSAGAYVQNASIFGDTAQNSSLNVTAYNAAYMGAGGGSGFSGGEGGLGLSFTFLSTQDPSGAGATEAEITNSRINSMGAVGALADDSSVLVGLSIDASTGSKTAGVNLSADDIDLDRTTTALVSGDAITATSLSVSSAGLRQTTLDAQLLSGAPSLATLSGYDFSTGGLPSSVPADPSGAQNVNIADGSGALVILAAGAGGAGENTAGAAVVAAQFANSHSATLAGGTVNLGSGELSIQASDNALIVGAAVGAGAADGQFAGVGSVAVLQSASPVSATLGGPAGSKTQVNAGGVDVRATDAGTLAGLTGAVSVSEGSAAFGASVTLVTAANQVSSTAQNVNAGVRNGHFTTDAEQNGLFVDLAITGAISEDFAIGGAATANVIDNGVQSLIFNADLSLLQGSTVNVDAGDTSAIYSGAVGFAVGSSAAAGVAVTANDVSAPSGWTSRVLAEITGGQIQAKDVNVSASSQSAIETVAAGGAVGDDAGVAGSVVGNANDGATRALITGGAEVDAEDNVGVIASSQNDLLLTSGAIAFAGEGLGIGLSSGVNLDSGDTEAAITGAKTKVNARARSSTDSLTVATGALTAQPDMSDISSATGYVLRDITLATQSLTGLAVNATSRERVGAISLGIGAAGEGAAAAVNAVVDDLTGTTSAHVDNASIGDGDARQQVAITAADHAFDQGLVASIAASGPGAAGAAAVDVASLSRSTQAYEIGALIQGSASVQIDAQSSQHEVGLVLGLAGSLVAGGGSTAVTTFNANTNAYASGGDVNGGSVSVLASDTVGTNVNTGAAAGGAVGAAASFNVVTSANKTDAVVGSADDGATEVATRVKADVLNVSAVRDADYEVHVVGGAVGGVGVAGMGAVLLSTDDTEAGLYDATVGGLYNSAATSSTVSAQESATADLIAGALSVGGTAGLGAAVGVIDSSSTVGALVADSNLRSATTSVASTSTKDYRAVMASAGGGATIGGEAGVGVILLGTDGSAGGASGHVSGSDIFSQAAPELSQIAKVDQLDLGGEAGGAVTSDQAAAVDTAAKVTLPASTDVAGSAILADVTRSTLQGAVNVTATDAVATQQYVGALALGGSVGLGANVGYTNVADAVTAEIDPSATLSGGSVAVSARAVDGSGHAGEVNSYVGAGGAVGLAAAASIVNLDDDVTATAGGALSGGGGAAALSVSASDDFSALNKTYNASVGGVAAGVVVSESLKSGTVTAQTAPSGDPVVGGFSSIAVQASGSGGLETDGLAAAGGIVGAGAGVYALSDDALAVRAVLGQASYGTIAGGISVDATRAPDVTASALGVAVSAGAALGASIAQAYVEGSSDAHVADGAVIGADRALSGAPTDLTVSAAMTMPGAATADAVAKAGVGGYFGGADATDADAHNTSGVQAYLGRDVGLPDGAGLSVTADRNSLEEATSTGIAVGGGLAVGANLASASAGGTIGAHVGTGLDNADGEESTVKLASLSIKAGSGATGVSQQGSEADSTRAYATSGSGAALAGAAAAASTSNTTAVAASLDDADVNAQPIAVAGTASVLADYTADTTATADSIQAALAGGSGSTTDRRITTTVGAHIGANQLLSATALTLSARANNVDHDSGVTVGAGGAVNADAGSSTAEINPTTTASVGDGAGLAITAPSGDLRLEAVNFGQTSDTSTMTTGGLVEVPIVSDSLQATSTQTVAVGDRVVLFSPGTITIGAYGVETGSSTVQASTYGALSYAEGDADTELHQVNTVRVGANDTVAAEGDISIMAGGSGDGVWTTMTTANAGSDVYNYTALPLDTRAEAHAKSFNASSLDVGSDTTIQSWEDVGLQAMDVDGRQNADAQGHNPYLQALSLDSRSGDAEHSSSSELTLGQGDAVTAGEYAHQSLEVAADGTINPSALFNGTYGAGRTDYHAYILQQIAAAQQAEAGLTGNALAVEQANIQAWQLSLQDTPDEGATGGQAMVSVGGITAAAGDVTLRGASMTLNTASVTANGGVNVSLVSDDPAALFMVGDITVPLSHATGGEVNVLGGADSSALSANIHEVDPGVLPVITIAEHGISATSGDHAVIVSGAVSNLGGTLNISNDQGDVDVYSQIAALQVSISAPEGNFILNDAGANFQLSAPETAWADQEIITSSTPENAIINYGVNALYQSIYDPNTDQGIQHTVLYNLNPGSATLFWNLPVPTTSNHSPDTNDGTYAQYDNKNSDFWFKTAYSAVIQKQEADSARTTPLGSVQADSISINANWIDLGAKITAGRPTDWGFSASAASNPVDEWDAEYASGQRSTALIPLTLTYAGDLGSVTRRNYTAVLRRGNLNATGGADNTLGASYDPVTQQVVADPLDAAAQGAVYLTGHIADTSASSLITVDAGLGQVNINNTIARPLVLQSLNTGSSATGQVVITDLAKTDAAGQPLTTWYEYDVNSGLRVYDNNTNRTAGLDGAELIATPQATSTTSGASAGAVLTAYLPVSGQRYYWQDEYDFSRVFTNQSNFQSSVTNWNAATPVVSSLGFGNYQDGATGDFFTKIYASYGDEAHSYKISAKGCYGLSNCTLSYKVATSLNVYEESSVAADHPATIAFTGQGAAEIAVSTPGDLIIGGQINNPLGTLTLSGPSASAGADLRLGPGGSLVTGALSATNFSLGTATTPLALTLTGAPGHPGAVDLTISAPQGAANLVVGGVAELGDIVVGGAASDGGADFRLAASGGISDYLADAATGGYDTHTLTAGAVTLDGGSGGVNVTLADAAGVTDAAAVVNVTAQGAIDVTKPSGDLYLGAVTSTGLQPVELHVPGGSILNALTTYTVDDAVQANLAATWSKLHLIDRNKTEAQQDTIVPFQNTVVADYAEYWFIQHNATVFGGLVSLSPQQAQLFQGEANIALGGSAPATADQVRAYVQGRLDAVNSFVATSFGPTMPTGYNGYVNQLQQIQRFTDADPSTGVLSVKPGEQSSLVSTYQAAAAAATGYAQPTAGQVLAYVQTLYDTARPYAADGGPVSFYTYEPGWAFTLDPQSSTYQALTRGAGQWTATALTNAVSSTALTPVSDTQIISRASNVTGSTVLLQAGGSIGGDAPSVTIPIRDSVLSDSQLAILAAAAPGDISIQDDAQGAPSKIIVQQRKVLGVDSSGVLAVSAGTNAYLQSNGAVSVALVRAPTAAKLYFAGGIGVSDVFSDSAQGVVDSADVLLEAGSGSIGSAAAPLTLSANVQTLSSMRAQGDIHIEQLASAGASKDLVVGLGYAGGALDLQAAQGSIVSDYGPSGDLHLQGGSIGLVATGDLGTTAHPLQVETSGGDLTGSGANLVVTSPGGVLGVGDLRLSGQGSIQAAALRFNGDLQARGSLNAAASGSLDFGQGARLAAVGELTLTAASIGKGVGADLDVGEGGQGGAAALTLTATSGDIDLGSRPYGAITSQGALTMDAEGGLAVTTQIRARTDATLIAGGALKLGDGSSVVSDQGAVSLQAASLQAGDRVTFQGAASLGLTAAGLMAFGDNDELTSLTPTAALDISAASLTAGGNFNLSSRAALNVDLDHDGVLTLGAGAHLTAQGDLIVQAWQTQGGLAGAAASIGDQARISSNMGAVLVEVGSLALADGQRWTAATDIDLDPIAGPLTVGVNDRFNTQTFQAHAGGATVFGSSDQIIAPTNLVIIAQGPLTLGAAPTDAGAAPSGAFVLQSGSVIAFGHSVEVDAPVSLTPSSAVEIDSLTAYGLAALYVGPNGSLNFGPTDKGGSLTMNETPYTLLYTAAALEGLSGATGGHYALATPVSLSGLRSAAPVAEFDGVFDGLGNAVHDLSLTTSADYAGLFGKLDAGGAVQNVVLAAPTIHGVGYVGGVVGDSFGTVVDAAVVGGSITGGGGVGGVIGTNEGGATAARLASSATVTGSADNVGGVAGASFGAIAGASFTGLVQGRDDVGGLVGFNNATLLGSFDGQVQGVDYVGGLAGLNYATLSGSTTQNSQVHGDTYVGGAVGWNTSYGGVNDVIVLGSVAATGGYSGGVAGVNKGSIADSAAALSASVSGGQDVGGLVGLNQGTIVGALGSAGTVTGSSFVGGLVGWNDTGASLSPTSGLAAATVVGAGDDAGGEVGVNYGAITGGHAAGSVSGANNVGGLVGLNRGILEGALSTLGTVSGSGAVGALVGWNDTGATVAASSGAAGGVVKDTGDDAGGYVGVNYGTITGGLASATVGGADRVGGFAGQNATGGVIQNATAVGQVSGLQHVGGFAGWNGVASLAGDTAEGDVQGSGDNVGGLAGTNVGSITSGQVGTQLVDGGDNVGGLVGLNIGQIATSSSAALVRGQAAVGGLVGANDTSGVVNDAFATGSVAGQQSGGNAYVGGLVGVNYGSLRNVYATGAVYGADVVGGLVGTNQSTGSVQDAYATGAVNSGGAASGALFGVNVGAARSLYWFATSGAARPAGYAPNGAKAAEVSAAASTMMSSYAGFDFVSHWWEPTDMLPTLSWTEPAAADADGARRTAGVDMADTQAASASTSATVKPVASLAPSRGASSKLAVNVVRPDSWMVLSKRVVRVNRPIETRASV